MHRTLSLVALILWVLTLTTIGWFFVRGWTASGSDGRTEIILAPSERDLVLKEMRELLKAVDRVIRELGSPQPDGRPLKTRRVLSAWKWQQTKAQREKAENHKCANPNCLNTRG